MGDESLATSLQKAAPRVIRHMNEDHPSSLLAYAHHYGGVKDAVSAVLTGLTATGFELDVTLKSGDVMRRLPISFPKPLTSAKELHKIAVAMHFEAFGALGLGYRLRYGYYSSAMRQVWKHTSFWQKATAVSCVGGIVAAGFTLYRRRK